MDIKAFKINNDKSLVPINSIDLPPAWIQDETRRWIDIENPDAADLHKLIGPLDLDPNLIKNLLDYDSRTEVISFKKSLIIKFPTHLNIDDFDPIYLTIICLPSTLITIHQKPYIRINKIAGELTSDSRLKDESISALLYYIFDKLIDENVKLMIALRERIDLLDESLDESPELIERSNIVKLKRLTGKHIVKFEGQLYCIGTLQKVESDVFSIGRQREAYLDLYIHLETVVGIINNYQTRLIDMNQSYLIFIQGRTSSRLRVLTIISAIFLPQTFLISWYALTEKYLQTDQWQAGYPIVMVIMLISTFILAIYFYKKGWFK